MHTREPIAAAVLAFVVCCVVTLAVLADSYATYLLFIARQQHGCRGQQKRHRSRGQP